MLKYNHNRKEKKRKEIGGKNHVGKRYESKSQGES